MARQPSATSDPALEAATRRFFCDDLDAERVRLPEAEARHAIQSLRLAHGAAVELFDGRGTLAHGALEFEPGGRRRPTAYVTIAHRTKHDAPNRSLHLIVGGCKGARQQTLVEKCTELGVTTITFTTFARTVVTPGAGARDKLHRAALEACKQCGRLWNPSIQTSDDWRAALDPLHGATGLFAAVPRADVQFAAALCEERMPQTILLIGPEGGFTDEEGAAIVRRGATPVTLADAVLRVETAAIAAAAVWSAAAQ